MAHKDSKVLALSEKYKLGKYEFSLETRSIPQTSLMDVIAKATGPAGKLGAKTIQIPQSTEINGWYVDANSTTADVYIKGHREGSEKDPDANWETITLYDSIEWKYKGLLRRVTPTNGAVLLIRDNTNWERHYVLANKVGGVVGQRYLENKNSDPTIEEIVANKSYTHAGKTVHYKSNGSSIIGGSYEAPRPYIPVRLPAPNDATIWNAVYANGNPDEEGETSEDILVGRFAIDNRVAGATAGNGGAEPGPDGQPWQDVDDGQPTLWPGDEGYPDPEDPDYPGDDEPYYPPSKTLYLEVDGALSGRHNDPLHDTSYSYIPADKATVKPYGYGGDGGHGGGGGGGASTVIVYKFATDKADSKQITVKPKRHGYGSGGGKGGKGGDGCILIYY